MTGNYLVKSNCKKKQWRVLLQSPILLPLLLSTVVAVLGGGCETAFDPFVDREERISVMGYLDASADTQFVRVEMLRDSILFGSGPLDVTVTLEHIETERQSTWKDSLFLFPNNVRAYNYWSTEHILPSNRYRIEVTPSTGDQIVSTEIVLPDSFPDPIAPIVICMSLSERCRESPVFRIDIRGIDKLAAFSAVYSYPDYSKPEGCQIHIVDYWKEGVQTPDGYSIIVEWKRDLERISSAFGDAPISPTIALFDVFVAAGGPEWPDFIQIDRETLFLPEGISNVENGIGFVGGVITKSHRVYGDPSFCDFRVSPFIL